MKNIDWITLTAAIIVGTMQIYRIMYEFDLDAITILIWNIWAIFLVFGIKRAKDVQSNLNEQEKKE